VNWKVIIALVIPCVLKEDKLNVKSHSAIHPLYPDGFVPMAIGTAQPPDCKVSLPATDF